MSPLLVRTHISGVGTDIVAQVVVVSTLTPGHRRTGRNSYSSTPTLLLVRVSVLDIRGIKDRTRYETVQLRSIRLILGPLSIGVPRYREQDTWRM